MIFTTDFSLRSRSSTDFHGFLFIIFSFCLLIVIQTTEGRKNLEYINVVVHEILRYTPFRSG